MFEKSRKNEFLEPTINILVLSSLQNIRSFLANFEYYLRQEKAKQ